MIKVTTIVYFNFKIEILILAWVFWVSTPALHSRVREAEVLPERKTYPAAAMAALGMDLVHTNTGSFRVARVWSGGICATLCGMFYFFAIFSCLYS